MTVDITKNNPSETMSAEYFFLHIFNASNIRSRVRNLLSRTQNKRRHSGDLLHLFFALYSYVVGFILVCISIVYFAAATRTSLAAPGLILPISCPSARLREP